MTIVHHSSTGASRITSDQLAAQFIDRGLTAGQGRFLTAKQAAFLLSLATREIRASGYHGPLRASNGAPQVAGLGWTMTILRNGAGRLDAGAGVQE